MPHKALPKQLLGFFPTPLHSLSRLSDYLDGPHILIKRDDQSGLAFGGNKTRKLEYLLGDALNRDCDTVVTGGAAQSNHCRQTAAAAACVGLDCHLVIGGSEPDVLTGNVLLDRICNAKIHWSGAERKGESIPSLVESLVAEGRRPYNIPYGGSNSIGAVAFVEAYEELRKQANEANRKIDSIVFASSSGGTQVGLSLGARIHGDTVRVQGVAIDKDEDADASFMERLVDLANNTCKELRLAERFCEDDLFLRDEFYGDGYGVVGEAEREAISLLARFEGILLDPVYTGRAFAGLLSMIRNGEFTREETVVFWHTGGTPALFPYAAELF